MIVASGNGYRLEGKITLDNVQYLLTDGLIRFEGPLVELDLSGVIAADSSAISLLLCWQRTLAAANRRLICRQLPEGMASLARLYGVLHLIV